MEFDSTLILIILFTLLIPLILFGLAFAWFVYTEDWPIKQPCLHCSERELRIISSSRWSGRTLKGKRVEGTQQYAQCRNCDALCEQTIGNSEQFHGKWELLQEERAKELLEMWEEEKERAKRIEEKNRAYNARKKQQ